jgi:capsular polysaccharide biosynthesis protein
MRALEARIPVGDTVTIAPSFQSTREEEPVSEERLGAVTVTGRHGRIYQRGFWLMQFSWYAGQTFLSPSHQIPPMPADSATSVARIEGACTSTISPFDGIYGHALLDELPFLIWLMEANRYEKFDTILCTKLALKLLERTRHEKTEQILKRARPAQSDTRYEIADFTAIRRTGCRMNPSAEELQLLRSQLPNTLTGNSAELPSRVYLARTSALRTVENEDEILEVLKRHGIAVVFPAQMQNPWDVFAKADIVIGVAGSDLADSVFMKSGATLLEIYPHTHIKPYYFNIAHKLGLRYQAMIASSQVQRPGVSNPANAPIWIDPDEFERRLETILA